MKFKNNKDSKFTGCETYLKGTTIEVKWQYNKTGNWETKVYQVTANIGIRKTEEGYNLVTEEGILTDLDRYDLLKHLTDNKIFIPYIVKHNSVLELPDRGEFKC